VKRSIAAAVLIALFCAGADLAAQPRAKSPQDQAREQYDRGVVAYNLERFDEAIAAFSRAYELDPAPILLYNIAQARWKKGEGERAIFYYRRYLEAAPAAPNRASVEARIQELERGQRQAPPAAASAPPPVSAAVVPPPAYVQASAPPPAAPPLYRRPWFWGGVAVAAAATVTTVLLLSSGSTPARCTIDCNLGMVKVPPL
jgi:tetratricopeptide (TPR) repeat protein